MSNPSTNRKERKEFLINTFLAGVEKSHPRNTMPLLPLKEPCSVVAIGKAAYSMVQTWVEFQKKNIESWNFLQKSTGIIITKKGHTKGSLFNFTIIESSHPIPDALSFQAGEMLIKFLQSITTSQVFFFISGGASSLVEFIQGENKNENIWKEIQEWNQKLLASGLPIEEVNRLRKEKSSIKGGKLLNFLPPCVKEVKNWILSDVLGDDLKTIASGLTIPSEYTNSEILGRIKIETKILANNQTAIQGCEEFSKSKEGIYNHKTYILNSRLQGEAKEIGRFLGQLAREIHDYNRPLIPPCLLILGGETTVTVQGKGLGGRNQEMALAFALEVEGYERIAMLAAGTDGTDGPTNAAGGIVDGLMIESFPNLKDIMSLKKYLQNNNSYHGLLLVDGLLVTQPTGTNVNDIILVFVA